MFNDVVKMEAVEKFVVEVTNAQAALIVLRPDLTGKQIADLERIADTDEDFYQVFVDTATNYIAATCPTALNCGTTDSVAKEIIYDIVNETLGYAAPFHRVGKELIDDIAAKIVWRMLNE